MYQQAQIREYRMKPMPPVVREKVERSYRESVGLTERTLNCPHCGCYIMTLYEDAAGHMKSKCRKCKNEVVFNLGYFRRLRGMKRRDTGQTR